MAPQSCVMNPVQGSPPSAAPEDTSELDLSSLRRCKHKSCDLPFSVESLISAGTPERSGPVRAQDADECASPGGLHELGDRDPSRWGRAPYASPPSECRIVAFFPTSLPQK